jgi:hypothetical protein
MLIISLFERTKLRQKHEKTPYLEKKWSVWWVTDEE